MGGELLLYRIAICDDEISQIKNISDFLTRFSVKTDIEFLIERFSDGNELLKSIIMKDRHSM